MSDTTRLTSEKFLSTVLNLPTMRTL